MADKPREKRILDQEGVAKALAAMAGKILERHPQAQGLALVGVQTGGAFVARRLMEILSQKTGRQIPSGVIDITLYRDDWTKIAPIPIVGATELSFPLEDKSLVLVDDVLFTGRTVRAAMDELMDFGRPARIELAVLVDRGHRELPICADYAGLKLETSRSQMVNVFFAEQGRPDEVVLQENG